MTPARRDALILGAAGLAAAAAGFLLGPALLPWTTGRQAGEGAATAREALRSANLVDLAGQRRKLTEWEGRILVCNFWATWCTPCREEIPLLMGVRQEYSSSGVEIVGIAIDNAAKVREFSTSLGISYPVLIAQADGLDLMRRLGNASGGLPYTVVANRQGGIVHRKLGAFRHGDLEPVLDRLVRT